MGRTRSFDEEHVIDLAAGAFRSTGYEGTSVDDLVQVTGLHRGSLYKAFGSKRGLFLTALQRALNQEARSTAVLDLVLVATLELAPRDEELRAVVGAALQRLAGAGPGADPGAVLGRRLLARARLDPGTGAASNLITQEGQS